MGTVKTIVIGVGGAGGNIVGSICGALQKKNLPAEFSVLNTDVQALDSLIERSSLNPEISKQIGKRSTNGLGAGSIPDIGAAAAKEDVETIRNLVKDKDLVMVVAGMGGGTGSGATPILMHEAREAGALTICWMVIPFTCEGVKRTKIAKIAQKEAEKEADAFVVIANDVVENLVFKDAMENINSTIGNGIEVILQVLLDSSLINLDFADFKTVLKDGGRALFSYASHDGERRADKVSSDLLKFSLQPATNVKKIKQSIVFIRGGSDMRRDEIEKISSSIQHRLDEEALIVMGVSVGNEKSSLDTVFFGTMADKNI
jgi:cell division protein FtsZ